MPDRSGPLGKAIALAILKHLPTSGYVACSGSALLWRRTTKRPSPLAEVGALTVTRVTSISTKRLPQRQPGCVQRARLCPNLASGRRYPSPQCSQATRVFGQTNFAGRDRKNVAARRHRKFPQNARETSARARVTQSYPARHSSGVTAIVVTPRLPAGLEI